MCIGFDKIDSFIRVFDGTRYLVLFGAEKYDLIYNKIGYRIGVKSGITFVISHNYAKIKIDLFDSLPLDRAMTFNNVKLLVKTIFNTAS